MSEMLSIGIIGDFTPGLRSHLATVDSLGHAAAALPAKLDVRWLLTRSLARDGAEDALGRFDGLWAAPGSPYLSQEGAHRGIRYAREHGVPFIAT
jgi:CTP synthase (UTP-ammonia lyase)